jgi:hypothetical protein
MLLGMDIENLPHELENLLAQSPISLRRWYVNNVVHSNEVRSTLPNLDPGPNLLALAGGEGPSAEHIGVASRLIYENMGRRDLVLPGLPTYEDPKTWNQGESMSSLVLAVFEPWNNFRYDPRSETVAMAMPNGQWAFHLKGQDSEDTVTLRVGRYLATLRSMGWGTLVQALHDAGIIIYDPQSSHLDASGFATAFGASESHFEKYLNRASALKETIEWLRRNPLMKFDTSVVNSVTGLAAFGNGVVPTDDVFEYDEAGRELMVVPAGKLISADREFMLSSAAGLEWPDDPQFNEFVQMRYDIHHENGPNTWEDWIDGSKQFADILLRRKCKTYKAFLDHAFPTEQDQPPEERDAFLRLLGAAVFGSNLKIVAAMIGAPNAGKDTVIKWLGYILGNDQVGVLSPMALTALGDDQRAFAPLKGAKIAVVSGEVGEGRGTAILAEKIKSITSGGGTLTVAEKYEKPTTIFFDGMLIMQGNSVPQIQGGDKALYQNRLVAVEFKHPFPLQANSYEAEYRREAPSFLQVLFLAYCDYVERGGGLQGIAAPQSWRDFGEDVEFNADPLAVIDRCLTGPDSGIEIPSPVFYKALSIMAERQLGLKYPISAQRWASRLKKAGVKFDRTKHTAWRSKVVRADFTGWVMHFTIDADSSDGLFSQRDWVNALESATVALNG